MFFRKIRWVLVVLCMYMIFMMSHLDGVKSWYLTGEILTMVRTGAVDSESDFDEKMALYDSDGTWSAMVFLRKFAHFAEYFVLAVLLMHALLYEVSLRQAVKWTLVSGISYGVLDELHQLLVPGRTCNVSDMILDAMGVIMGCTVVYLFVKYRKAMVYGREN